MNDQSARQLICTRMLQSYDIGIEAVAANDCFGATASPMRRCLRHYLRHWMNKPLLARVAGTTRKSAIRKSATRKSATRKSATRKSATRKGRALFLISRAGSPLLSTYVANTWWGRLKGLFAYPALDATNALLLQPCSAVHTFGFNYSIDVVFLDKSGVVIKCAFMKPYSICICRHAHSVIEMAGGSILRLNLHTGQQLQLDANGVSHD